MTKWRYWMAGATLAAVVLGWLVLRTVGLSALDEPGATETAIANAGKSFLIGRSAAREVSPADPGRTPNPALGRGLFIGECSQCHGFDGRTPSEMGLRMYPRVADLGSEHVQSYTDEEIFWILKNGIRLTGMPGLGDTQPDPNLWAIVDFIRSLPDPTPEQP